MSCGRYGYRMCSRQPRTFANDKQAHGACKPQRQCAHETFVFVRSTPVQRTRAAAVECGGAGRCHAYPRDVPSKIQPADAAPKAVREVSAHHGSEKNSRQAHDLVHHFSFREVNRRFFTASRFRRPPFDPHSSVASQNSEPSPPFTLCDLPGHQVVRCTQPRDRECRTGD